MNTEITDNTAKKPFGWVFYDGECALCVRGARRWGGLFAARGFVWLPLQSPGTTGRLGGNAATLREEMKLLLATGEVVGGVEAWAVLLRSVWWLWPAGALLSLPGIRWLGGKCYAWLAHNRYCIGGSCRFPGREAKPRRHSAYFELP